MLPTVLRNFSWLLAANIFNKACSFAVMILLIRMVGAEGFGIYSWVLSLLWVLLLFADFGTNESLLRECSSKRMTLQEGYARFLPLKIILLLLTVLLTLLLAFYTSANDSARLTLFLPLSLLVLSDSFGGFLKVAFRIEEKMEKEALLFASEGFLKLLFISLLALYAPGFPLSPLLPAFILMAATLLITLWGWKLFKESVGTISLNWRKDELLTYLKLSAPLALLYVFSMLNFRVDTLMLPIGVSDEVVGAYSAAWRLLEQSFLLPILLSTALFPTLTRMRKTAGKEQKELLMKVVSVLSSVALLLTALFYFSAFFLLPFLYGDEFKASGHFFALLSFALLPFYLKLGVEKAFIAYEIQRKLLYILVGTVALNVLLNYVWIPEHGAEGASWATILSEWCGGGIVLIVLQQSLQKA